MGFLGVYKAIYDYAPQGESELAISEGDILYVLEKSGEDDWWKAKKKAAADEDDEPTGLIPNNYVEEAHPIHQARALYDYTRQTDEELSFTEDSLLEVFDASDPDWILVGLDGEYGFAPANYIEVHEDESAEEPPPPSLPRRPAQAEVEDEPHANSQSPAAAIAGILHQRKTSTPTARAPPPQFTPEASDDEEGPSPALPARPGSQARPPQPDTYRQSSPISPPSRGVAASPSYNRAARPMIDDDPPVRSPGGFHLYNINEMVHVMGKKKKMPTTLGINAATGVIMIAPEKSRDGPKQEWTAEKMTHYSIEGKHIFMELVRPSKSVDFHAGAKDTAEEIVSALGEVAGAVRAEGLREVLLAGSGQSQKKGQVLYDFMAQGDDEVTVAVGDEVIVLDDSKSEEWWQVRRIRNGKEGVVPSSYVEITGVVEAAPSGINAGRSTIEQNRLEEERLAKESLKVARMEDARGSEVGPGMRLPQRGSSLTTRDSSNITAQQRSKREHDRNDSAGGQSKSSKSKPDSAKLRTWTDRSKSFSVEAQFLALKDGKINLHKQNGVKIAVPVAKMSVEDLEYVERITGVSLDEDKPLSDIKKRRSQAIMSDIKPRDASSSSGAGATIERPPEYDWFQFFLSCDIAVGLCERYSQIFNKGSMDESTLPDVDATVLRALGIREGDIIKIMRFLDKKWGRSKDGRSVSFGGENGDSPGGLFSGPGGTLRNNTRKGRPAPPVQTNDVIDAKAFSQDSPQAAPPRPAGPDSVPTPLAKAPVPIAKDPPRGGFDDDAWDVKPTKQPQPAAASQSPAAAPSSAPAPTQQPSITGSMQELSLLTQPLEPARNPLPPVQQQQPTQQPQQTQGPPPVTPSIFQGIGQQQTGLPQPQNIARQRPAPPQNLNQNQNSLMPPPPPNRPLSAPQANQNSGFNMPAPLQPQNTGIPTANSYQPQLAPYGQSLNDLRQQQQYTGFNGAPNQQMTGMMPQQTGAPYNGMWQQQNGFQNPMQTGMPQQQFMNNGAQQFGQIQPQPTGFQSSFGPPQQQYPQPTGINASLPPPLQPTPTGMQSNTFVSSFTPPPVPPIPQQQTMQPLVPQKTGPPPPVRFGVSGDTKKLMPQATGRRANLSQATPQNPFGF